ncbi:helix-turn-helix domain-containing protein [Actinoplanes sp. CA-142083]|uniref:helix-turn-helix domain-containing protein n=1 Tax=Actinoplanes sp. CA-142083 TaxID=3239903 RepID=UPI003D91A6F2
MPRPKLLKRRRPMPNQPSREQSDPVATLKQGLRELKERDGDPSYRELAKRSNFSHTVLAQAVSSTMLPTWQVTEAFVAGCGGDPDAWRSRWEAASDACRPKSSQTAPANSIAAQTADGDSRMLFASDLARRIDKEQSSRKAVADKAGFAPSTLSVALSGQRLPRPEMLSAVLGAVGASPGEIDQWLERRVRLGTAEHTGHLLAAITDTHNGWQRASRLLRWTAIAGLMALTITVLTVYLLLRQSGQPLAAGRPAPPPPSPSATPETTPGLRYAVTTPVRSNPSSAAVDQASTVAPLPAGKKVFVLCRILTGQPMPVPGARNAGWSTVWALLSDGRRVPFLYLKADGSAATAPDCEHTLENAALLLWPDGTATQPDEPPPPQFQHVLVIAVSRADTLPRDDPNSSLLDVAGVGVHLGLDRRLLGEMLGSPTRTTEGATPDPAADRGMENDASVPVGANPAPSAPEITTSSEPTGPIRTYPGIGDNLRHSPTKRTAPDSPNLRSHPTPEQP